MARQLPTELYIDGRPGDSNMVEHLCMHATGQSSGEVVAVAVAPVNIAQASNLLFGTGIGVVGTIDDLSVDPIDQARRSVATGATEIALPVIALDQMAILTHLRSRLGSGTPLTVAIANDAGDLDTVGAERALRLGADFISFIPDNESPTMRQDIVTLLSLARDMQLGGVKIAATDPGDAAIPHAEASALAPVATRLCIPLSLEPE